MVDALASSPSAQLPALHAAVDTQASADAAGKTVARIQVVGNNKQAIRAAAEALVAGLAVHESMELWSITGGEKGTAACIWAVTQAREGLKTKHNYDAGFTCEFMGPFTHRKVNAPNPPRAPATPTDTPAAEAASEVAAAADSAAVAAPAEAAASGEIMETGAASQAVPTITPSQMRRAKPNVMIAGSSSGASRVMTASYTMKPLLVAPVVDPLSVERPFRVIVYRREIEVPVIDVAAFLPDTAYALTAVVSRLDRLLRL